MSSLTGVVLASKEAYLRLNSHLEALASLWYNKLTLVTLASPSPAPLCNQCGSKLIRVAKKTKKVEGQKFPITIITYKCSDKECQKRIDKDRRERLRKEKERTEKKKPHN